MDNTRFARWLSGSAATAQFEPFMPIAVQGLGTLDASLFRTDRLLVANGGSFGDLALDQSPALNNHMILSYLWVLGAYEIVRTIRQRCREAGRPNPVVTDVVRLFERVRVPLAKFEPAKRHTETDSKFAYPALNSVHGAAWQVAADVFIARGELADSLLALLDKLRADTEGPVADDNSLPS